MVQTEDVLMGKVGQKELVTQQRVIDLFQEQLQWEYLGNWHHRDNNRNVEESILTPWLKKRGVNDALITRALRQLDQASALGEGKTLYYANKDVYNLLRYGIKDKTGAGEKNNTVWLFYWNNPQYNHFAIAY